MSRASVHRRHRTLSRYMPISHRAAIQVIANRSAARRMSRPGLPPQHGGVAVAEAEDRDAEEDQVCAHAVADHEGDPERHEMPPDHLCVILRRCFLPSARGRSESLYGKSRATYNVDGAVTDARLGSWPAFWSSSRSPRPVSTFSPPRTRPMSGLGLERDAVLALLGGEGLRRARRAFADARRRRAACRGRATIERGRRGERRDRPNRCRRGDARRRDDRQCSRPATPSPPRSTPWR